MRTRWQWHEVWPCPSQIRQCESYSNPKIKFEINIQWHQNHQNTVALVVPPTGQTPWTGIQGLLPQGKKATKLAI